MRVGNIGGLGSVYDHNGNPILHENEDIVREISEDNILVLKGEGRLRSKTLLDTTKERGTLYLTDRRLIFLRRPDEWKKFYTYGNPFGMDVAFSEASYARELEKAGGMEYLELDYGEVKSFKSKKAKWADLHLQDRDGIPIRVMLDRRDRKDDKLVLLEELLIRAGAQKLS